MVSVSGDSGGDAVSDAPLAAPDGGAVDLTFMHAARAEAALAAAAGEVPVGALVVRGGEVVARAGNRRERDQDPCGHAELIAIRAAAQALGTWRLDECVVYVTLEPCPMCAGAMVLARVQRCVFGCADPKGGFLGTLADLSRFPGLNHHFVVTGGVDADACQAQLRSFFRDLRVAKRRAAQHPPPSSDEQG
ncbi:MAG: nucleoside deaminase [Deltaproteobacteria bacterium]|nr:nucleoside deaminase [Deltaproteobacteria bacterium]